MCLNHPETIPPPLWSMEKLSSVKPVPAPKSLGATDLGDRTAEILICLLQLRAPFLLSSATLTLLGFILPFLFFP